MKKYLLLVLVILFCTTNQAVAANIVLIMADDLGYGDVGSFYKNATIRTPNIDRLAVAGIRFTNYHVNTLCTPTRAAVMTGQYTFDNYEKGGAHKNGIVASSRFLPQMLQDAGYKTGGFGKWHLADNEGDHPLDRGFDEWIGFYGGSMQFHYELAQKAAKPNKNKYNVIYEGKTPYKKEWQHTTDLFTDLAIQFIKAHQNDAFFLYLSYNAVHTPIWNPQKPVFSARQDWVQKLRNRGLKDNSIIDYNALVEHMDNRVGDVIETIQELGLADNTLIIFQSDNGPIRPDSYYSKPQAGSAGTFRGGKSTLYEGGIRVPLILSKGQNRSTTVVNDLTMHADILPTCLEHAGIKIPELNGENPLRGHSLYPYLMGSKPKELNRPLLFSIGHNMSLIEGDWKLINVANWVGKNRDPETTEAPTDGDTLYNLKDDPSEQIDLASQYPEKLAHLRRIWEAYFISIGKTFKPSH